ncbi:unnamed protein product, partial [Discosporangium mesarthrocarpum]
RKKVYAASLSKVRGGQQQSLVAVGSEETHVRLCDIRSGGFTHTLVGHSESVRACLWSPGSEFLLATGSQDHTVSL